MSRYVIKSILANNFKGIPYKDIQTVSDLTLINLNENGLGIFSGPNGYGKTTIFDIVEIIFSKNITRFNSTSFGNETYKDNGLLNNNNFPAIIGVILTNEKKYDDEITILGFIKNNYSNKEILDSIKKIKFYIKSSKLTEADISGIKKEEFTNFEFIEDINSYDEFKDFNSDVFNLFYYISQEESTHFLKKKANEKTNTLDNLVNIDHIVKQREIVKNMISGNYTAKINNLILKTESSILENLKLNKAVKIEAKSVEYERIFEDRNDIEWDKEEISFNSEKVFSNYINEVKCLIELLRNKKEFSIYHRHNRFKYFFNNIQNINNFLIVKKYDLLDINKRCINIESLNNLVNNNANIKFLKDLRKRIERVEIENELNYFDIKKSCEILGITKILDENDFTSKIKLINDNKLLMSSSKKVINNVVSIREKFIESYKNLMENKEIENKVFEERKCPLCGSQFSNENNELIRTIDDITSKINTSCDEIINKIANLRSELKNQINDMILAINEWEKNNSEVEMDEETYKVLIKINLNEALIKNINEFAKFIFILDIYDSNEDSFKSYNSLKEYIESKIGFLSNEFIDLNSRYKFMDFYDRYFSSNKDSYKRLVENTESVLEKLEQKCKYIGYVFSMKNSIEVNKRNEEIRKLTKELILLEKVRDLLKLIYDIYNKEIIFFRDKIISDIEMPLYLYTGKILQNYQRGLGVFIKKDNTRVKFVPNNNSDHEIINSFSSGQLSGFVIAFMLVMNKVYTNRSSILNTILIDDPVQTMDDINIASLVEVLRSEFKDKQILLSTHEDNKANYIMYKFSKHDIQYKYFNVKDIIYSNRS